MNLTRPEKKLHTHDSIPSYTSDIDNGCIECIKNKLIDDMSAYQNQQMEGLEEYIKLAIRKWYELPYQERDMSNINYLLATKIRELLSQKGGE